MAAALLQRISQRAQVVAPRGLTTPEKQPWLPRLRALLPAAQQAHLLDVLEKDGELVLFVDSAAWAARVRLSLPELAGVAGGREIIIRLAQQKGIRK